MKLLNKTEVAERLSLSTATIWRLVKAGKLPRPLQVSRRRVAWIEHEIDDAVSALKRTP